MRIQESVVINRPPTRVFLAGLALANLGGSIVAHLRPVS